MAAAVNASSLAPTQLPRDQHKLPPAHLRKTMPPSPRPSVSKSSLDSSSTPYSSQYSLSRSRSACASTATPAGHKPVTTYSRTPTHSRLFRRPLPVPHNPNLPLSPLHIPNDVGELPGDFPRPSVAPRRKDHSDEGSSSGQETSAEPSRFTTPEVGTSGTSTPPDVPPRHPNRPSHAEPSRTTGETWSLTTPGNSSGAAAAMDILKTAGDDRSPTAPMPSSWDISSSLPNEGVMNPPYASRADPDRAHGREYLYSPPSSYFTSGGDQGAMERAALLKRIEDENRHASSFASLPAPMAPPLEDHIFMFANLAQLRALISSDDELVEDYPNWRVYRSEMLYAEATPEYAALMNKHILQRGASLVELDDLMGRPGIDGKPRGRRRAKGRRENDRGKEQCVIM